MFDKDVNITGMHGDYMHRIVAGFDAEKNKLFRTGYDVYRVAAIVGFLYGRKAERTASKEDAGKSFTIFAAQMNNIQDDLMFNYRLIMLLDKENEPNLDLRLQKAFNYYGDDEKSKTDRELFNRYTLGGIEILFEKLINGATAQEDYLANLFNFIQEVKEYFHEDIEVSNLIELSRKIQSK